MAAVVEFHAVLVGRAGGHAGTGIYVEGPCVKRVALARADERFRREQKLPSSVALITKVMFSGTAGAALGFVEDLMTLMDEATQSQEDPHG